MLLEKITLPDEAAKRLLRIFLACFALSILAKWAFVSTIGFSVDDYLWISFPFNGDLVRGVAMGDARLLYPLIADLTQLFGFDIAKSFALSAMVLISLQAASAVLVCQLWKITDDFVLCIFAAAMIVLHPFQVEPFVWKLSLFTAGLPFFLAILGVWLAGPDIRRPVLGAGFVFLSALIHQLGIPFAAVAVIFAILLEYVRVRSVDRSFVGAVSATCSQWRGAAFALLAGAFAYVIMVLFLAPSENIAMERKSNLLQTPEAMFDQAYRLLDMLLNNNALVPEAVWITLGVLMVLALVAVVGRLYGAARSLGCLEGLVFSLVTFAVAILISIALVVVVEFWAPYPRTMSAMPLVFAGSLSLAVTFAPFKSARITALAVTTVCLLSFAAVSSQMVLDQYRANQRDTSFAQMIVQELQNRNALPNTLALAFVGYSDASVRDLRTATRFDETGAANIGVITSVFQRPYSNQHRVLMVNEVTPLTFAPNLTAEQTEIAKSYCAGSPSWPDARSMALHGRMAIVCLGGEW